MQKAVPDRNSLLLKLLQVKRPGTHGTPGNVQPPQCEMEMLLKLLKFHGLCSFPISIPEFFVLIRDGHRTQELLHLGLASYPVGCDDNFE